MSKQEFWESFEQLMPALEQLISGDREDYVAYNALSDNLHNYSKFLIPEITLDADGHYVLIISCEGYKQGIAAVESITRILRSIPNGKLYHIASRARWNSSH
jgi:hypothetical protein